MSIYLVTNRFHRTSGFNNLLFHLPHSTFEILSMVGVAQLVEHQVVALVVVGSSPITHPI